MVTSWLIVYLLLVPFLGNVTLLQPDCPQEVSEVAKQGDNSKADVGEDSHMHGCLFEGILSPPMRLGDRSCAIFLQYKQVSFYTCCCCLHS